MDKKIIQKSNRLFSESEKHEIIKELFANQLTKQEIWEKYTGEKQEHGQLLRRMKKLGYNTKIKTGKPNFVLNQYRMAKEKKAEKPMRPEDELFENLQLKKRVAELEKQLKESELKAIAFSTMVDIAEKEFKIPIRKKYNTKP
ncbi:MAG TPA: hypothetical protein VFF35_01120 [Bacteroidia bacterium]|nr:hypothetical protein [Bacteroidia bacterium]